MDSMGLTQPGHYFLSPKDLKPPKWYDYDDVVTCTQPVYSDTEYEKELPTEDFTSLVRDRVRALQDKFYANNVDVEKMLENVMVIIPDGMFEGKNRLPEWEHLVQALQMHQFEYAYGHVCFWSVQERFKFFDDLYSAVMSSDDKERAIVRQAFTEIRMFDDDWRKHLDDPHEAPLKKVLHKYGNLLPMMTNDHVSPEDKRWEEGVKMIFFMKNCVDHLTRVEIGPLNQRFYSHIDFLTDDPLYKDIEFFNHMATHFLYPNLWIELYAALYAAGYKF